MHEQISAVYFFFFVVLLSLRARTVCFCSRVGNIKKRNCGVDMAAGKDYLLRIICRSRVCGSGGAQKAAKKKSRKTNQATAAEAEVGWLADSFANTQRAECGYLPT
jgi:hypothetical protein